VAKRKSRLEEEEEKEEEEKMRTPFV